MKWNEYKILTAEQKEEYNYKFRNRPIVFSITGMTYAIVILFNTMIFMFFSLYINLKENILTGEQLKIILNSYAPILRIIVILILVYVFASVIQLIIYGVSEHLWKKKNNVIVKKVKKVEDNGKREEKSI